MILVDASVWVDHFRAGNGHLGELAQKGRILVHPLVVGEVACGNLRNRGATLAHLQELRKPVEASHAETLHLLETERLWGLGIGWVDLHLLASSRLTPCHLWTMDLRLREAARKLGLDYRVI